MEQAQEKEAQAQEMEGAAVREEKLELEQKQAVKKEVVNKPKGNKMRLVFYYTHARNVLPKDLETDGITYMFRKMLDAGIIQECICIIDNYAVDRAQSVNLSKNLNCIMVNGIEQTKNILKNNDIIFIRGGFKPWIPFIQELIKNKQWIIFYGANTGNERWPFWDIVLDDLNGKTFIDIKSRLVYEYIKAVNEDIFKPLEMKRIYDIMIGASYIHDKKGQWKIIDAIKQYEKKNNKKLKCVLPGSFRRGSETNKIHAKTIGMNIDLIGMVSRQELAKYYNQSNLLIKLGGGQNDRSLIEAMACGCQLSLQLPHRSAPYIANHSFVAESTGQIVSVIQEALAKKKPGVYSVKYHNNHARIDKVLDRMEKLFTFFRSNPIADRRKLDKLLS